MQIRKTPNMSLQPMQQVGALIAPGTEFKAVRQRVHDRSILGVSCILLTIIILIPSI